MMFHTNDEMYLIEIALSFEHLEYIIDDPVQWESFRQHLKVYYLAQKERLIVKP